MVLTKMKYAALALFSVLLCAATPAVSPEDFSSYVSGTCIPRSEIQGSWDCLIIKEIRPTCPERTIKNYDQIWKLVKNEDEAAILIKSMYVNLEGPLKFGAWLACQGFTVQVFSKSAEGFPEYRETEPVSINIGYSTKVKTPFPLSWLPYLLSYGAFVQIAIDKYGQISKINQTYTYE